MACMTRQIRSRRSSQEAREEAGIDGEVGELAIGSYLYLRRDGQETKPAQAVIFSLKVDRELDNWNEKDQRRRKWFKAEKAAEKVFEPDQRRFLGNVAAGRIFLG